MGMGDESSSRRIMVASRQSSGSAGGPANEAGSSYRAALAVWFIAHALAGREIYEEFSHEPLLWPTGAVLPEANTAVDDLWVEGRQRFLFVQAKRSLTFSAPAKKDSEFAKAVGQLVRATKDDSFNTSTHHLAIAVGKATEPLRELQNALVRRRTVVTVELTSKERAALEKFKEHIQAQGLADPTPVLDSTSILYPEDVSRAGPLSHSRARDCISGLVSSGQAQTAVEVLAELVSSMAGNRQGADLETWVRLLRQRDIHFLEQGGTPASQVEARLAATERFREVVVARASRVRVLKYPLQVEPNTVNLPVCPAEELHLMPHKQATAPLSWALRLNGRIVLRGLPASGKSTALRRLAGELASDDEGPLPLRVHLPELVRRKAGSPLESAVDCALKRVPDGDRELVREEALRLLRTNGRAALLFDALDECFDRQGEAVELVRDALCECHGAVEVVLASRDSSALPVRSLGFRGFHLLKAKDLKKDLARLAQAANEKLTESDAKELVEQAVRFGGSEPFPVLLAAAATVLTARHSSMHDKSRGELLSRLIDSEVLEHEHRMNTWVEQSTLQTCLGVEGVRLALGAGFNLIAWEAVRALLPLSVERATEALAEMLVDECSMPNLLSKAAAFETLRFWDGAGVFLLGQEPSTVRPQSQVFAELGAARFLKELPVTKLSDALESMAAVDKPEVLRALAPLSRKHGSGAVNWLLEQQSFEAAQVTVRLVREGQPVDTDQSSRLAKILAERSSDSTEELLAVQAICSLSAPTRFSSTLDALIGRLQGRRRLQARIMQAIEVDRRFPIDEVNQYIDQTEAAYDAYAVDMAELQKELEEPRRLFTSPGRAGGARFNLDFRELGVEDHVNLLIARQVPASNSDLAARFLGASDGLSNSEAVCNELESRGFVRPESGAPIGARSAAARLVVRSESSLSSLDCSPMELDYLQSRRLSSLVALRALWAEAVSVDAAFVAAQDEQAFLALVVALADASSWELEVLKAEANLLQRSGGQWRWLAVGPGQTWEPGPIRDRALVDLLEHESELVARTAVEVLRHGRVAGPIRDELLALLRNKSRPIRTRDHAFRAFKQRDIEWVRGCAVSEDPFLHRRGCVLLAAAYARGRGVEPVDVCRGLNSWDLATRQEVWHQLEHLASEDPLHQDLVGSRTDPPTAWWCPNCGTKNSLPDLRCCSCHELGCKPSSG